MKKQNIAIIAVIALVLAVSVGYALFSQTLTITGTATASGNFDVQFTKIGDIKSDGYTDVDAVLDEDAQAKKDRVAKISTSPDAKTGVTNDLLTIKVNKLSYPGAYVEIPVEVTNKGSIPVVLESITENNLTTNSTIKVSYTGLAASTTPLETNGTHNLTVRVEWLEDAVGTDNSVNETVEFSIKLNYKQVTATSNAE